MVGFLVGFLDGLLDVLLDPRPRSKALKNSIATPSIPREGK
jgi:hypothetical protein